MSSDLVDARGVPIAPGDTAIYGFGVGRSVAMAEAVVLGEEPCTHGDPDAECTRECPGFTRSPSVSLTPSGRVRLRVVRRSYGVGEKPVVTVGPDRLVVLKDYDGGRPALPPSPLPTQEEDA